MSLVAVFEYKDYKRFLLDWIAQAPNGGRGVRKDLAAAIGCQTPFVTHVLGGDYHLSAEQAEACARWLGLSDEEIEFFVLLVLRQRAGSKNLEKMLSRQISRRREAHAELKGRLKIQTALSDNDKAVYYSNWLYPTVHLAVAIPELQSIEALQNHFHLPAQKLIPVLDFLTTRGLIIKEKSRYKISQPFLYLSKDSPHIQQHHMNWRLKALSAIAEKEPQNLHYSGVLSLSHDDFEWLRERMSSLLEEAASRLKNSKDEAIAALNLDLFSL